MAARPLLHPPSSLWAGRRRPAGRQRPSRSRDKIGRDKIIWRCERLAECVVAGRSDSTDLGSRTSRSAGSAAVERLGGTARRIGGGGTAAWGGGTQPWQTGAASATRGSIRRRGSSCAYTPAPTPSPTMPPAPPLWQQQVVEPIHRLLIVRYATKIRNSCWRHCRRRCRWSWHRALAPLRRRGGAGGRGSGQAATDSRVLVAVLGVVRAVDAAAAGRARDGGNADQRDPKPRTAGPKWW